jgi:hypothetical protein
MRFLSNCISSISWHVQVQTAMMLVCRISSTYEPLQLADLIPMNVFKCIWQLTYEVLFEHVRMQIRKRFADSSVWNSW